MISPHPGALQGGVAGELGPWPTARAVPHPSACRRASIRRVMDAERIVQLALGVPDAIQPTRRREAAILALAKLAGESVEFHREAGDLCRYAYEEIVAALDVGEHRRLAGRVGLSGELDPVHPAGAPRARRLGQGLVRTRRPCRRRRRGCRRQVVPGSSDARLLRPHLADRLTTDVVSARPYARRAPTHAPRRVRCCRATKPQSSGNTACRRRKAAVFVRF